VKKGRGGNACRQTKKSFVALFAKKKRGCFREGNKSIRGGLHHYTIGKRKKRDHLFSFFCEKGGEKKEKEMEVLFHETQRGKGRGKK